MQQIIDSAHFAELIAYDMLEAIPDSWHQAGTVAATIANAMGSKKPLRADDFIPKTRRKVPTLEQQKAMVKASVAAANRKYGAM